MNFDLARQSSVLIACEVMRDEILAVLPGLDYEPKIVWLERGLHNVPKRLTAILQETIDAQQDSELILLGYGLCGKGTCDIVSSQSVMVVPRFHDCIGILRSLEKGMTPQISTTSYYLTGGWIEFFEDEAARYKERYGDIGYEKIAALLFQNYQSMTLLTSGACSSENLRSRCLAAAESLSLSLVDEKGSLRVLEKLLQGSWDDEFLIVPPGQKLALQEFINSGNS